MTDIDSRLRQQCSNMTACSTVQTKFCRYTELIRLCFQHKWIASLGAVSTVLCTPLQISEKPMRSFTSVQMIHTHQLCTVDAAMHFGRQKIHRAIHLRSHARTHTRQNWIFEEIHQELSPLTCNLQKIDMKMKQVRR